MQPVHSPHAPQMTATQAQAGTRTCSGCQGSFEVTKDDLAFYDQVSPTFDGKKFPIPPPTHCPDCRQQRRLLACNEFTLYNDTCELCKKSVITEFHPGHSFPIYCRDCYLTDKWDPLNYGQEIDFNRPFFDQLKELCTKVPHQNLNVDGNVQNSDYIHYAGTCKNCYLIMHADYSEDCYYVYGCKNGRSCVDGFYNLHSELCYDCVDVHKSYGLTGCQDCINCHSSAFLRDCIGCKSCFLCTGLRQKEYCFENEQLTKEEYNQKMKEIDLGSYAEYQRCKQRRRELELKHTFKEFQGHNTETSSGDYLQNCKNVQCSFDCEDVESAKYCYQLVLGSKDCHDIYQYGTNLQQSYYCSIAGENSYHGLFSFLFYQGCSELLYCAIMDACKDCFGCTNLRNNRYCILNKQYTKEEYEKTAAKLIEHMQSTPYQSPNGSGTGQAGEWGQFLPPALSHFGYNETTAQMYYPLKKEEALAKGFQWYDGEPPPPKADRVIDAAQLPDSIDAIPEDVINWAIRCEVTGKLFKLTKQEYEFYKDNRLPVPRRRWYQRHLDRFAQRNPRKFWKRSCDKCSKEIQTTYSPERPEIVYCEECYLSAVY